MIPNIGLELEEERSRPRIVKGPPPEVLLTIPTAEPDIVPLPDQILPLTAIVATPVNVGESVSVRSPHTQRVLDLRRKT